jgi:hypothetical protein
VAIRIGSVHRRDHEALGIKVGDARGYGRLDRCRKGGFDSLGTIAQGEPEEKRLGDVFTGREFAGTGYLFGYKFAGTGYLFGYTLLNYHIFLV